MVNGYIRANYGHSTDRLDYKEATPPTILYHGTNTKVIHNIFNEGIKPMGRKYVDTEKALANQVKFYKANHGVWLADLVPSQYLKKLE
jgi:putative RNA 2'-phosphotransferase